MSRGRPTNRPPKIDFAKQVTEEHVQWTIDRFFNMRQLRPLEWQRIPTGLLTQYFNQVFRKEAKNKVLELLVDRKILKRTVDTKRGARRMDTTTFYELTEEALKADGQN